MTDPFWERLRTVDCPYCHAVPGQMCQTRSGRSTTVHRQRSILHRQKIRWLPRTGDKMELLSPIYKKPLGKWVVAEVLDAEPGSFTVRIEPVEDEF